jgi:hypothetical protein
VELPHGLDKKTVSGELSMLNGVKIMDDDVL